MHQTANSIDPFVCDMKFRCVNWQKSVGGVLIVVAIDKGNPAENRRWPLLIEDMEDPLRLQSEIFDNTNIPVNRAVAFQYVPLATSEGFKAGEPANLPQFNTVRLHRFQEEGLLQAIFCVSSARRCPARDLADE